VDDANPGSAHLSVPSHCPYPVFWQQVPLLAVDLNGHGRLRPPGIRAGQEFAIQEQRRIEERDGQAERGNQLLQVRLGRGPRAGRLLG
jgi:hypothetical protein